MKVDNSSKYEPLIEFKASDIKILNVFIVNEIQHSSNQISFDVLATNGRAELIKQTVRISSDGVKLS